MSGNRELFIKGFKELMIMAVVKQETARDRYLGLASGPFSSLQASWVPISVLSVLPEKHYPAPREELWGKQLFFEICLRSCLPRSQEESVLPTAQMNWSFKKPIASGLNLVFLRLPESLALGTPQNGKEETREPEEHRHLWLQSLRAALDMGPCVRGAAGSHANV